MFRSPPVSALLVIFLLNIVASGVLAVGNSSQGDDSQDPFRNINYSVAFDPTINRQHTDILRRLGLEANALGEHVAPLPAPSIVKRAVSCVAGGCKSVWRKIRRTQPTEPVRLEESADEVAVRMVEDPQELLNSPEFKAYTDARLAQVVRARRTAVLQQAKSAAQTAIVFVAGGALTAVALGPDSLAGGFGVLIAIVDPMYQLPTVIRSLNNYWTPRGHVLDALEKRYARTQCFIPYQLWPYIEEQFMLARQNVMAQAAAVEKIKFVLGLTTYYPLGKSFIVSRDNLETLEYTLNDLDTQITAFFDNYDGISIKDVAKIQAGARNFIYTLLGIPGATLPRNLYFVGIGGIGKTHFMKFLAKLINEKLNNLVFLNTDLVITSGNDLEGTDARPGAFLRILQQMCEAGKQGALVIMDEVKLNAEDMVNPAKRVFNGGLANISTKCFGQGADGTGIPMNMPPLWAALGSNDEIVDPALASRFSIIHMGTPKKERLLTYAQEIFLKEARLSALPQDIGPHIKALVDMPEANNFRYMEENIPPMALLYRQGRLPPIQ